MVTKTITWPDGSTATLNYTGQGNGTITIQSDPNNNYEARSAQVTVRTTDGSNISQVLTIVQAAKVRIDISTAVVTAANQTYSGSAKTPTPTVTLNGVTIPSSGYNVAYSNNTNAGTATVTVTGKGDYTGTATGTFTIAKASRTISFTTAPAVVIVGGGTVSVAATVSAGSGDGTISYSSGNTSKATVSGSNITGVSAGTCSINATVSAGTNYISATTSYTIKVGSSDCIDMGLPSNTLWRSMNVGATSVFSQSCQYFSWGNTDGHTPTSSSSFGSYSWGSGVNTEPYASSTGKNISTNLGTSNDAARAVLGSPWRMPSTTEFEELFSNCKFVDANEQEVTSTNKIVTVNGTPGLYLKSNINGNKLFIPCCGYGDGSNLVNRDGHLLCWHSTITSMERARVMLSYSVGTAARSSAPRYQGIPIRPVQ